MPHGSTGGAKPDSSPPSQASNSAAAAPRLGALGLMAQASLGAVIREKPMREERPAGPPAAATVERKAATSASAGPPDASTDERKAAAATPGTSPAAPTDKDKKTAAATPASTGFPIEYKMTWMRDVMQVSTASMVPFRALSLAPLPGDLKEGERRYPRSFKNPFTLGGTTSTAASAGGRETVECGQIYSLCELLPAPFGGTKAPLPISDIAILSKRAVCLAVRSALTSAPPKAAPAKAAAAKPAPAKRLKVMGGSADLKESPWPIHGYPMLCMTASDLKLEAFTAGTDHKDAYWRIVQCVFGAALTREIRERGIGIEVVSREGFGSVFPTLATIPDGIRLDPGLLPPEKGSAAIVAALAVVESFIASFPGSVKPKWAPDLASMDGTALANADRLLALLHAFTQESDGPPSGAEYAACVSGLPNLSLGKDKFTLPKDLPEAPVSYTLPGVEHAPRLTPVRRELWYRSPGKKAQSAQVATDTGYGSDSDYDDEKGAGDTKAGTDPDLKLGPKAMKKISVVSGMAALRMATYYAMAWTSRLFKATGKPGASPSSALAGDAPFMAWAQYFELDMAELAKLAATEGSTVSVRAGAGQVLVFDSAPNPINIPTGTPLPAVAPKSLGAIVIDTTNATTKEKAEYLAHPALNACLAPPNDEGLGGLMILVDSVSKHPTGGDLVHGVVRVYGPWKSVETFYVEHLVRDHLKLAKAVTTSAAKVQTVLAPGETAARRAMIASRLVARNADLVRWLWALPKTSAKPL